MRYFFPSRPQPLDSAVVQPGGDGKHRVVVLGLFEAMVGDRNELLDYLGPAIDIGLGDNLGDDPPHFRVDQFAKLFQIRSSELGVQFEQMINVFRRFCNVKD